MKYYINAEALCMIILFTVKYTDKDWLWSLADLDCRLSFKNNYWPFKTNLEKLSGLILIYFSS